MSYVFKGRLCGYVCEKCDEPLSGVTVRLYRAEADDKLAARAAADPRETLALLSDADARKRSASLLAEGVADASGAFSIELGEGYEGGAFEVDLYFTTVPRPRTGRRTKPLQVAVTTLQPSWRTGEQGSVAAWEYCLPARVWCAILARFGVWSICGHLRTCKEHQPIPGALVRAFDSDWLQDDPLGSATTDFSGHFLISYLRDDFEKTPLSPWGINFELVGGPDVYFSAELGGSTILQETQVDGRKPGRQNIGPCFCVDLCTDKVIVGDPETVPHWLQVEDFDIHPAPGTLGSHFSVEGYAGDPAGGAYVFGGGVRLRGNCPLVNVGTGNALEYRFLIGEWTWLPPGDDPATLPSVAPAGLVPVTQLAGTLVGYVFYTDGNGFAQSYPVVVGSTDNVDGWIKLQGRPVTVPMYNPPGSTAVVNVDHTNFIRTFDLFVLNSPAITAAHPAKLPGGLPKAQAGSTLTPAQREPIRRYALRFEVRDAVTLAALPGDQLDSVILDNSPVVVALDLEELRANACNPLAGAAAAHILYTVDHPHLRWFRISIGNNNGQVHPPPAFSGLPTAAMPSGDFAAGNFFFRGGAGGPHQAGGTGGVSVNIGADPSCAYAVTLSWLTRRYYDTGTSTQILYCK